LVDLRCEAKCRHSSRPPDAAPAEGLPLALAAVNVGQSDDDQSFLVLKRVA
jgi:hypothetical protein